MGTTVVVLCIGAVALMATAATAEEKVHELRASPSTVHRSFFDASLKPVLTIDSGDIVRPWTTTGNPRYFERLGVPKEKIPAELYAAFEGAPGAGRDDHTLDGPIEVRGAEIGDTVEIRIRSIDMAADRRHELPRRARHAKRGHAVFPRQGAVLRSVEEGDRNRSRSGRASQAVLGRDRSRAAVQHGTRAEWAAEYLRRQHGQPRPPARHQPVPAGPRPRCPYFDRRRP